ncbi:CCA tRNA nucleotidyltransferase [Enterococcus sp. AD013-P3]|uniref:CCA tRNA nucleotidyltransferase n=1 Tax=Enterococcus sp. AD013-P3 TaxID=3411036 RepID=UPI003B951497
MKLTVLPEEFRRALPVMEEIEKEGFEAYFVGGSVRDVLLGQPIHDVDIATSAFPAEIKAIFSRTVDIGIEHGTVLVLFGDDQYEITTFRTESTYQDFRRPDQVSFVRSLAEDLKRRDFTINAFAVQDDGEVIDLFGGLKDLEQHVLRAVGNPHERFHEDALRMMRGLRFVSQLGFSFDDETFAAILENHSLLEKISVERIFIEFTKLLLGGHRNEAIRQFVATKCYRYCPGMENAKDGLTAFAQLVPTPFTKEEAAWSVLLDHLEIPTEKVTTFLKAWKVSNDFLRECRELVWGLRQRKMGYYTPMALYRLGERALTVETLLTYYGRPGEAGRTALALAQLPIRSLRQLAVNGNDLKQQFNQKAGPWLKDTLHYLEQGVVESRFVNDGPILLAEAEKFLKQDAK